MKITTKTAAPEFTPVDIVITCESQAEIDVLHVLGSYNATVNAALSSKYTRTLPMSAVLTCLYNATSALKG